MKKITTLFILLYLISNNSFSLTDLEKYDLFYSATDVVFITSLDDSEEMKSYREEYFKEVKFIWDSLWTGNSNAKIRCFNNKYFEFDKLKRKSNKIFKDIDHKNTLFILPSDNSNVIFFLNANKKMEFLVSVIQPPYFVFSGGLSSATDFYPVMMSMRSLKSKIDLLRLNQKSRKSKKEENSSLKPMSHEISFFYSSLFNDNDSKFLSKKKFKEKYPYKVKISSVTKENPDYDKDSPSPYVPQLIYDYNLLDNIMTDSSIRYLIFTREINGVVSQSLSGSRPGFSYSNRDIYIYDKKNGSINLIDIMGSPFFTDKYLKRLLKKIEE